MIRIKTDNRAIDITDLARLEERIARPLPAPYRAFLLDHNGGTPEPDTIDIQDATFKTTDVQVLHGIDDEFASCDLLSSWENLDGCKENQLLPIAHDSGGHSFALVLAEEDYGHVYYFDSTEDPPKPNFVANDFDEFLSKIREPTPEELGEDETSEQADSEVRQDDDPDRNEPSAD